MGATLENRYYTLKGSFETILNRRMASRVGTRKEATRDLRKICR